MKRLPLLLALLGIGAILLLLLLVDRDAVWAAIAQLGWPGFGLLLLGQGGLFVVLGLAWAATMPGTAVSLLIWGRAVRDAATTCLPFSHVGGYVVGARAITLHGVPWPAAAAGTVLDVTAEIVAQLLFTLFGVAVLILLRPGSGLAVPIAIGSTAALVLMLAALWQRHRIATLLSTLGRRLLGDWFSGTGGGIARLEATLAALYSPGRLAAATALHLVAWVGTGALTWLTLRLLGAEVDLVHVIALEALIDALVGAAFIVPAAAGVQEGGYVILGAAFGVPPELALGVSLLRRARDLVWGIPVLLAWQWLEVRRLRRQAAE